MLVTVVVKPAKNGKAPHIPQPINPKKKSCLDSLIKQLRFLKIMLIVKGSKTRKTKNHLQKAKEIGGTCVTPPRAMIELVAIKAGCIKSKKQGR